MKKYVIAVCLALVSMACGGPRYVDYFPYHDDGRPKPKVAVVALKDACQSNINWEFSEELAQGLYCDLMEGGQLYVLSQGDVEAPNGKRAQYDFTTIDAAFATDFCEADFVAVLELIDHAVVPYDPCTKTEVSNPKGKSCLQAILTNVRVKVVDVRCSTPRIVLCEVIKSLYPLDVGVRVDSIGGMPWGSGAYYKTPCGMAHYRAIKEISHRLEDVIQCSR